MLSVAGILADYCFDGSPAAVDRAKGMILHPEKLKGDVIGLMRRNLQEGE